MAKKVTKPVIKTTEEYPEIKKQDVLKLAVEQGYSGIDSLHELRGWLSTKYSLHGEIFYSMFHKKFSINNYFINSSEGKKVDWDWKSVNYSSHTEALIIMLYNMLLITK